MAFKATNFMYAGRASELFGLIVTSEGEGVQESTAGSSVELVTDKSSRATTWEIYGVKHAMPLTFDVRFTSQSPLDRYSLNAIEGWLLGQPTYQRFLVDQPDMINTYYNCVFTEATNYFYNNDPHTIRCTAICDAPWAWEFPRVWKPPRFQASGGFTDHFLNKSADSVPMLPGLKFTLADDERDFHIINRSMGGLDFGFDGVYGGETLTVDGATGQITSSTGEFRADKFNKTFLRLQKGVNELVFTGKLKDFELTYQNAKKVGV